MTADLPITLSMDSSTPLYDQITSQLRQLIVADVLPAGSQLPSVRALATSLGCSVITTRRAYQELEQQGLIRTFQGRGTMVADVPEDILEKQRIGPVDEALRHAVRQSKAADIDGEALVRMLQTILTEEA